GFRFLWQRSQSEGSRKNEGGRKRIYCKRWRCNAFQVQRVKESFTSLSFIFQHYSIKQDSEDACFFIPGTAFRDNLMNFLNYLKKDFRPCGFSCYKPWIFF